MVMWEEQHICNQKIWNQAWALLHISSDTQSKPLAQVRYKMGIRGPILSFGVGVQTKPLYEEVCCKPHSAIHNTAYVDLLNPLFGFILLVD